MHKEQDHGVWLCGGFLMRSAKRPRQLHGNCRCLGARLGDPNRLANGRVRGRSQGSKQRHSNSKTTARLGRERILTEKVMLTFWIYDLKGSISIGSMRPNQGGPVDTQLQGSLSVRATKLQQGQRSVQPGLLRISGLWSALQIVETRLNYCRYAFLPFLAASKSSLVSRSSSSRLSSLVWALPHGSSPVTDCSKECSPQNHLLSEKQAVPTNPTNNLCRWCLSKYAGQVRS